MRQPLAQVEPAWESVPSIAYYNEDAQAIKWTYTVEKLEKKLEERKKQHAEGTYELIPEKKDQEASEKLKNREAA